VWAGEEECDNGGNNGPNQACLAGCVKNVCGDGDKGPGEQCDDGNMVDDDGCDSSCLVEGGLIWCGNKIYQCGNDIDDDMDGKVDLDDPECTSPCDDDESSFKTLLPGQNEDCKSDCYWDDDSGVGNDGCEWNLKCDPENPGSDTNCEYDPDFKMCDLKQTQMCKDICGPITPNGCDCFGCCEIQGNFYYLDGNVCDLEDLSKCDSCTFHPGCNNPCEPEECEVCFGDDPDDLPDECDEPKCDNNLTPCEDESDCMVGEFCQTGCCVAIQPG
jgi:cysteine-rich repeat protein